MASIPRYRAEQRLGSQGPYEVASPSQARQSGENLAQFGGIVMKAASIAAQYDDAKSRADLATVSSTYDTRAALVGQESSSRIISNADKLTAPDGSNMETLYEESFQSLYADAGEIEDFRQRQAAYRAIDKQKRQQGQRLFAAKAVAHGGFTLNTAEDNVYGSAAVVANDPSQYQEQMDKLDITFQEIGLSPVNYKKAKDLAEKNLNMAIVQHYTNKRDYAGAEKAVKERLAGKISIEEQNKILKMIDSEMEDYLTDQDGKETRFQKRLKKEKVERQEKAVLDVSKLFDEDINAGLELAKEYRDEGAITHSVYMRFMNDAKKGFGGTGAMLSEAGQIYQNRLQKREGMDNFVEDIYEDETVPIADAQRLVKKYQKYRVAEESGNSAFINQDTRARQLIRGAFPGFVNHDRERAERSYLRYLDVGDEPVKAAIKAVREIDPSNKAMLPSKDSKDTLLKEKDAIIKEIQLPFINGERKEFLKKRLKEITAEAWSIKNHDAIKREEEGK